MQILFEKQLVSSARYFQVIDTYVCIVYLEISVKQNTN